MKILMTADTVGGVWTYCIDLCKSLQPYDVEIHLVTMGDKMKEWQWKEVNALEDVIVYETDYRLEWMQDPWSDIKECSEWLLRLEDELHLDLIHLNCFAYGALPFKAPVIMVAHSDVYSWFLSVKGENPPVEWKNYFWYVKKGLEGADQVIAPSEAKLSLIRQIFSIEEGNVIYNGRDQRLFHTGEKQPFIFCMGRIWDEAKNIKLLIDAAPSINARIKIAGDNSFDQNCFDATESKVHYLGKLSTHQVAEQLSTASIYVLPARYEPFGLSALEAALSGCALVLGDIPSLREIWSDAAIYVNTNDAEALAETVNALMQDQDVLETWRRKALARAQLFSLKNMVESYWQLYQQLVQQNARLLKQETV